MLTSHVMERPRRLTSLDGLRGVAAVVVVVHHALLTFPQLADAYYERNRTGEGPLSWALAYTPLHLVWAGTEAVYLFFILSGIVLVLPVLRAGRRFSWLAYYPQRIVRLYLPVIAAVAWGALIVLFVGRFTDARLGSWMNARPPGYTPSGLAQDITLVFGTSRVISPLWSLRWEVLFSLLLPIFVVLAVVATRLWWLKLSAVFLLIPLGSALDSPYLFYLPMFAVGALLVAEWQKLGTMLRGLDRTRWGWPAFSLIAVLLTTITWTLAGLGVPRAIDPYVDWIPVVGVAMLVLLAGFCGRVRRVLESPIPRWLGTISFSLYLVHEPLIIAARLLTFPLSAWVGLLISIPLAFGLAFLFARFIEQPAHMLSKWIGSKVEALFGRRTPNGMRERGDRMP